MFSLGQVYLHIAPKATVAASVVVALPLLRNGTLGLPIVRTELAAGLRALRPMLGASAAAVMTIGRGKPLERPDSAFRLATGLAFAFLSLP